MTRGTFQRFYSPDDPPGILPPPTPTPTPTPEPEPRHAGRVTCEGCGCALDSRGKIIMRGDGLKAHLDREDEVKRLTKELATAAETEGELRAQVAALTPKPKRNIFM